MMPERMSVRFGAAAFTKVALVAAAICMAATSAAWATDLESFYFRYDFSDGTRQFIGSASQASDPATEDADAANFVAAYGQDGAATAVHIKSNAYGSNTIGGSSNAGKAVLAGDWTLAMSVRPGSVEKGLLFSLGRANDNNSKCVFLASSSTAGKIYVGTARKKGSANSYTGSVDRELAQEWGLTGASADTTSGYHSIVAVHSSGGTVAVYVDGELAGSVDTTENASGCVFGNGIQFNQAHGSSTFLSANGYSQSLNNPDVAFQDVRFYNSAFTAEDAAAYAALYPATLPGFSNLGAYAYVQSYGVNGVDTGYKATDDTKFVVDFEFTDVSYKSWLMGASESGLSQTHAIYLNGSKQLAWTTRGQHWVAKWPSSNITGASIKNVRLVENILSTGTARDKVTASVTWYNDRTTMNSKLSNSGNGNPLTTKGPSTVTTHLFRGNGIMENDNQACMAKIYSFEVDDDCTSGLPAAFFAPTMDANGAAGFTNVVAGTFHGECLPSPSTALTFTSGVGRAEDYRYRSGKFYSRIYASSADSGTGLVKFDGGEAAGTNAQFTARGRTAKIIAVPAEYYAIDRWEGDTWAIADGYSANDATIEVKSDTAIKLTAVFKYMRVATPALGDGFTALFNAPAAFALSCTTEGASIYYTLDGTTPTTSSTLYEGTFSFNPENMFTTLKVIAVKDGWYDSEVFEVKLVNLAVAPRSAYAQSGTENLLLHLDAVENAGAGTHADSPTTWADLAGSHTVTETGSAGFQADAWTADGNSYFVTSSTAVKDALVAKAFTLELVISNPGNQVKDSYEYWMFFGADNSHRQLVVDLREKNSKNPLVQGVQYRESAWDSRSQFSTSTITKWNTRQYIAVVCDSTGATTYCNGTNQIHKTSGGSLNPSQDAISIGAAFNGSSVLYSGSEICAMRMTSRAITEDERMRNFYVDSQRFGLESAPVGYCITNGNVKVRVSDGVEGFEFSTDGGTTWAAGEVWVDINTEVTLSARVAASTDMHVNFKNLPEDATTSGNSATFTPTKPCTITVSAPRWTNNDGTGSFENSDNWIGGVLPTADDDFTVNISGDTVITVNEDYSLGSMTVQGTGNVTFTGAGSIGATTLDVASGLTVDTCGKLTVTGFTGAGNVVLTPASGTLAISSASTLTGDLTIKTDSSVAFNVNAATSVSNFYVRAATNAVVTMTVSGGSFSSTETVVQHGVLRPGSADAFNATPKVTVEDGGTLDVNGLALSRSTTFSIAGAGAGDWPWALTSSVNVDSDSKSIDIVSLADDATIGGNVQICIGVRSGAMFYPATQTLPLTLNGHTLTKTGTGTLWFRRPYSTNEGTIDVQAGTLRVNGWSNANAAYGESCVSNIALVVHEGTSAKNELSYTLYFKSLDLCGGALTSSSGAFGVRETLFGHGSPAKLAFADGATATLDGNLTVSSAMTAARALSLTRKAGVETNVTVAATGTLTASGAITVGAGVIFNIGANRPTGTLTVADDATIVLRKASALEENIVLNVTANPQNIVVYDIDGTTEISNPTVTYDSGAGTVTIRVATPHWTNSDGTGSLDSAANWTVVPSSGDNVILELSADTAFTSSAAKTFGQVSFTGTYSADFSGAEVITLSSVELNNVTNLVTGGKLRFTAIDIPQTCTVTITGAEGLGDGKLTGKGSLIIDPGAGNTYTMTKSNTGYSGEAVIKSGTVKFGDSESFGPIARSSVIRVKGGATLDENGTNAQDGTYGKEKQTAVLEDGAKLVSKPGISDTKLPPLTTLTLEGDATVDTTSGMVSISQHYNDNPTHIKLGTHTLTKVGAKDFFVSQCKIEGTGVFDIKNGAVVSTHDYDGDSTTTCANGTIRIREGASWKLASYQGHVSKLSVKNLILDGSVSRDANTYTLTVTGSITGNGTTPMLTMGSNAVFKPSGTGYLNVTESLSGTMKLDLSEFNLENENEIKLVKVPVALTNSVNISNVPAGWRLRHAADGGNVNFSVVKVLALELNQRATGGTLGVDVEATDALLTSIGLSSAATASQVTDFLNATDPNGLRRWENLVTGMAANQPPLGTISAETSSGSALTISVKMASDTNVTDKVNLGYTVLRELRKGDGETWTRKDGPVSDGTAFDIGLLDSNGASLNAAGLYRVVTLLAYGSVTNEIPSTNAVGIVEVGSTATNTITAVPWKRLASVPDEADSLTVSNFVSHANLSAGDAVYMLDGRAYKMWRKRSDGTWEAATTVSGSGASISLTEAGAPDTATIPCGGAVWVQRAAATKPYFLVGQYDESAFSVTVPGSGVALVANPFSTNVTLNAINWGKYTGVNKDVIRIPRNGSNVELLYDSTAQKWGYYIPLITEGPFITGETFVPYDEPIPAGTGFLYYRKGGEGFTLEWK